jgi:glycosyltransferase involved in cell wall biosynthesis
VLESLASGVPVVSTRVGGVPYLVAHERTALLVEPGDAEGMAEAMLRVLRDAPLKARLKAAGLEAVRQFDWASVKPRLLAVYESATRRSLRVGAGLASGGE